MKCIDSLHLCHGLTLAYEQSRAKLGGAEISRLLPGPLYPCTLTRFMTCVLRFLFFKHKCCFTLPSCSGQMSQLCLRILTHSTPALNICPLSPHCPNSVLGLSPLSDSVGSLGLRQRGDDVTPVLPLIKPRPVLPQLLP